MDLTKKEQLIAAKLLNLKSKSGTHSPSNNTILDEIPELNLKVDACFLSNPYATELFMGSVRDELILGGKLREYFEYYPSQNSIIAETIAKSLDIESKMIFVGNGAVEIIQAVMHNFVRKKVVIILPTFSSYYEFLRPDTEICYYQLKKERNFQLDVTDFIEYVKGTGADSVVIINPNNPTGNYVSHSEMSLILDQLSYLENLIIDESFIHFAYECENFSSVSISDKAKSYSNLIIIKSMSKDFGIAGIRAGYAIMESDRVRLLLSRGYLWNSSGLAEYFFRLYTKKEFIYKYELLRLRYIKEAIYFYSELSKIDHFKVYPSKANFALIELNPRMRSVDFVNKLLIRYGVYTRSCNDKKGLNGEFVRIACRSNNENTLILDSIKDIFAG